MHDLDRDEVRALGVTLDGWTHRQVEHALGITTVIERAHDLSVQIVTTVDVELAVKQVQVTIRRMADADRRPRRLRLVALAEWQLGSAYGDRLTVATQAVLGDGAVPSAPGASDGQRPRWLCATQQDHRGGFGGATVALGLQATMAPWSRTASQASTVELDADDWTCDRREFFDNRGQLVLPAALGRRAGAGLDPCAALGCRVVLRGEEPAEVRLLMVHAASPDDARPGIAKASEVASSVRLRAQQRQWNALLGAVQVHTPDAAFDALMNHWLGYQTIACRLWARAGYYQAGGAYGFRDQLQDAMALAAHAPGMLAAQIRRHAARQFPEGDVQHWWHEPGGAGVRTRFADDLLWLPLALAHHARRSGAADLFDETAAFLEGAAVPPGAEDLYETPRPGPHEATLYEHGARAIDRSLAVGAHGLPLMGSGDWNDGMNRVGHGGRGESVWMAWFLCHVVDAYLPWAERRGDAPRVQAWREARRGWVRALDAAGWDGAWYRRAYFDDGTPLGSTHSAEARIDLIAQAWAVLSGAGDRPRAREAMASAERLLLGQEGHLARLLDPPLQHAQPDAGYIQAYPRGVRENGGQYNHAGVWALMALAQLGRRDAAWDVFTMLSPAHRAADAEGVARYGLEPYVMAGDVYTHAPWQGRGGWSWYTGSAGWLLRAGLESLCGVVVEGSALTVTACLPPHWPQAVVTLRRTRSGGGVHDAAPGRALQVVHVVVARDRAGWRGDGIPASVTDIRPIAAGQLVDLDELPDQVALVVSA